MATSTLAGTSNYLQNHLIDWELRAQVFTPPATVYVALLTCTNGAIARSLAYALNNTVSFIAADGNNHLYKCTTAGTTAASAPAYPGDLGEVITDGTAVFTEQTVALQANTAAVEPSGNAYARVAVLGALTAWAGTQGAGTTVASTGVSATTSNNAVITFPTPTGTWTVSPIQVWGFATFDAAIVGNLLRYGGLAANQIINTGNTVSFAAGALTISNDQV